MVGILTGLLAVAGCLIGSSSAAPYENVARQASWPNGPFVTDGRWIRDASGNNLTYAGVNWPGHGEVMVPEGLQYQSIETIVTKIKSTGMNSIRLTYAIEMIDQIYDNGGEDITLQVAFQRGLGSTNGTSILQRVLANNPQFTASSTRLQIFDAVVAECAKQQIYIHLDNHISKGMWCCGETDGNAWWGDRYFHTGNWTRGLAYMATHGKQWPNLMSMSLRNEPRNPSNNAAVAATYNWRDWYGFIKQGTTAINNAHPDLLIFLSGLSYDTYMTPVVQGTALTPGTGVFSFSDFPGYANKLVIEIHNYENGATSCTALQNNLYNNGFQALSLTEPKVKNRFPVMMTEFGFSMTDNSWRGVYASCLAAYYPTQKAGWFLWVLAGSYYIRSGIQDYEEAWGLLNHDWSDWRNAAYVNQAMIPSIQGTLA